MDKRKHQYHWLKKAEKFLRKNAGPLREDQNVRVAISYNDDELWTKKADSGKTGFIDYSLDQDEIDSRKENLRRRLEHPDFPFDEED